MSLINRNEIRRLEKAAREKDKKHLAEWASNLEIQMLRDVTKDLENKYQEDIQSAWENLILATAYTLHFSEETKLDADTLPSFMEDLLVTVDMYRTGEYSPKEYEEELDKCGVKLEGYDYQKVYKDYIGTLDKDLVAFIKKPHRKIITICGSSRFKDIILEAYKDLTLQGHMVFMDAIFEHKDNVELDVLDKEELIKIHQEKILLSDAIYVINYNDYIGELTEKNIKYAKEHNKEIMYYKENKG